MTDFADQLEKELPFLRRYARALTGDQTLGDDLSFEALQAIRADRQRLKTGTPIRVGLFQVFHVQWVLRGRQLAEKQAPTEAKRLLDKLSPNSREALLLATLEGFSSAEIAIVLDIPKEGVSGLLRQASQDMQSGTTGNILIIEDEPLIATDLTRVAEAEGHHIVGIARTHQESIELVRSAMPDLILADIQLADGSSGIDAVQDILEAFGRLPIIFITAFPERLLTGQRPEPAFLITKPYKGEQVTSAISQAMFFSVTEALVDSDVS